MKESLILGLINLVMALGLSILVCQIIRIRRLVFLFLVMFILMIAATIGNLFAISIMSTFGNTDPLLLRIGFPLFSSGAVAVAIVLSRRSKE